MGRVIHFAVLMALCAAILPAQGIADLQIQGSVASAKIELPGGVAADLKISFEQVLGLSQASLGLSAELVNPLDAGILSRLPDASLISVPGAFPVRVGIEPPATGPLTFTGIATVELHTHNLTYTANSPLRLFAAPLGGGFADITTGAGMGSYRARGTKGSFSEFLILADVRPVDSVIGVKFQRLMSLMEDNADSMDPALAAELQAHLDDAAWSWSGADDTRAAIAELEAFVALVEQNSGSGIPNTWRSARDLVNVAGELRAAAGTLLFSLRLKESLGL